MHTGNGVEFRDSALAGGIEAFGLSAHLKEDFLFLQFTCELFLQSLRESRRELYSMCVLTKNSPTQNIRWHIIHFRGIVIEF